MTGFETVNHWTLIPWLVFAAVWAGSAFFTKKTARRPDIRTAVTQRILLAFVYLLLLLPHLRMGALNRRFLPASVVTAVAGVAIEILGIAGAFWARFHLGRNWSPDPSVKRGHELVETGPYAFVRHPIYSAMLLAFLGTAVARAELRGLVAVAIGFAAFFVKARVEEELMIGQFGAAYLSYMRRVKMLLPFVL